MAEWRDVTSTFSEAQRHYKDTYLEQDEVYDEDLELSVFSTEDREYEIYFSYGRFYGIVYVQPEDTFDLRDQIKEELQNAYDETREPTDDFINRFAKKYEANLPLDMYYDFDLAAICEKLDEIFRE